MQTQSLARYLAEMRKAIMDEYRDTTRDELADTLATYRDVWFAAARDLQRGDVVPVGVYRSYAYHLGREEAYRTFRCAGNWPELSKWTPFTFHIGVDE